MAGWLPTQEEYLWVRLVGGCWGALADASSTNASPSMITKCLQSSLRVPWRSKLCTCKNYVLQLDIKVILPSSLHNQGALCICNCRDKREGILKRHCSPCLWQSDSWDNNWNSPKLEFPGMGRWASHSRKWSLENRFHRVPAAGQITLKERRKLSRQDGSMIGGPHRGGIAKLNLFLALCWNPDLMSEPRRLSGR